jgi:hypothetical protein
MSVFKKGGKSHFKFVLSEFFERADAIAWFLYLGNELEVDRIPLLFVGAVEAGSERIG